MIITGDLHFGLMSDSPINKESDIFYSGGTPWKLHDSVHLFREMIRAADEDDHNMVICGDIFDSANPSVEVVNIFLDCLQLAQDMGVRIYLFAGNHDVKNDFAATQLIKTVDYDNVVVAEDEIDIIRLRDKYDILMVFKDQFSSHNTGTPKVIQADDSCIPTWLEPDRDIFPILFSHGTPKIGMFKSNFTDSEKGNSLIYDPEVEIYGTDLTLGTFFKFVFLGHIHQHYKCLYNGQWIISPGSPLVNDFGERNDQKGYIRFDVKTKEWFFIPFVYKQKEYIHCNLDLTESSKVPWSDDFLKPYRNKVIKVIVTTSNYLEVPEKEIKEKLNSVGAVVKFETQMIGEQRSRIVDADSSGMVLDHSKLLNEWVQESHGIPEDRKDKVISLGEKIIGDTDA